MTTTVLKPVSATDASNMLAEIYDVEQEIKNLTEIMEGLQEKRQTLLKRAVSSNITEGGDYAMVAKPRITRSINAERFKAMFPEQFEYCRNMVIQRAKMKADRNITLQDAEGLLGKDVIAPVCDVKTVVNYIVVKTQDEGMA